MRRQFFIRLRHTVLILAASGATVCVAASAKPPSVIALGDFIDGASYRLSLADQVALTKWDSRKPIEDASREKTVIDAAVGMGVEQGLAAQRTSVVFADQIEANKLVQYRLLAQWARAGAAPTQPRPDLVRDIRPKLDSLQTRLIGDLVRMNDLLAQPDCSRQVAAAVGEYVKDKNLDPLHELALDRAMARLCEK